MHRLGQHFLTHAPTLRKIAAALELRDGDTVVEIGPGHGELTEELGIRNKELRVVAIEKDRELAHLLRRKFNPDKAEIIYGDALRVLPSIIHNSKFIIRDYKVTGNIPYYITGYLFRILSELDEKPSHIVFLVQKEVAQRIVGQPPRMNLLAASIQIWAEPKIIGFVPKKYFRPAPKVDSSIIVLTPRSPQLPNYLITSYYRFIKMLFKQPRKTVVNNLRPTAGDLQLLTKRLQSIGINPNARPQNLNIESIRNLARTFHLVDSSKKG